MLILEKMTQKMTQTLKKAIIEPMPQRFESSRARQNMKTASICGFFDYSEKSFCYAVFLKITHNHICAQASINNVKKPLKKTKDDTKDDTK